MSVLLDRTEYQIEHIKSLDITSCYAMARYVFTSESQLYVCLTTIDTLASSCHLGSVWLATGTS